MHIIGVLKHEGVDSWWTLPGSRFVRPGLEGDYVKSTDTMDVWFDSGTSWTTMGNHVHNNDEIRADLYFEGSDQHRGWFQSSLITSGK